MDRLVADIGLWERDRNHAECVQGGILGLSKKVIQCKVRLYFNQHLALTKLFVIRRSSGFARGVSKYRGVARYIYVTNSVLVLFLLMNPGSHFAQCWLWIDCRCPKASSQWKVGSKNWPCFREQVSLPWNIWYSRRSGASIWYRGNWVSRDQCSNELWSEHLYQMA